MARCAYCNSWIIGGVRADGQRFCNEKCRSNALLRDVASRIPDGEVAREVVRIHQGNCPKCGRRGPVDVHSSHHVWSVLLATSWNTRQHVVCTSCGRKENVKGFLACLVAGWWGFPWGLVMTPVMITKNLWGIFSHQDVLHPSNDLVKLVRLSMARNLAQDPGASGTPLPPGQSR